MLERVECTLKIMEKDRVTVIDVTVKKDSLLVYVLKFYRNFGGSVW